MSRKFGKVWDYPTERKFRRVTAIADDGNIAKGESYEIARKFRRGGEVWYELKGAGEHKGDIFVVTYSTLGEAQVKGGGSTKLSRQFAKRYIELSGRPESEVLKKLSDEFNLHEFTVKRLAREANQLRMKYGKKFEGMLESRLFWGKNMSEYEELLATIKEIVRSVLSDIANLAPQKFRTQNVLTEKEETDVQYRTLNQKYANKIEKYLEGEPELQQIGKDALALVGQEVDERLGDLILIFRPSKGATEMAFGHLKQDPDVAVIEMPLLRGPFDSKHLATRFGAHKDSFGHEFTHYVDEKRRKSGKQTSAAQLKAKGKEAYYNTPEEFNAYYQEGVTKLLKIAKSLKKQPVEMKSKLFPPDIKKFMKGGERPKKIWGNDFIGNMNPKYRKKFAKRVADLFPKVINTVYTEKERASLQRHLAKKNNDIPDNIVLNKKGIPELMSKSKAIETINVNSSSNINLKGIRDAFGDNDSLVKVTIEPKKLAGISDIDPTLADPKKGAIFLDNKGNVVDGRHRAALASQKNEPIEAFVPVNRKDIISHFTKKKAAQKFYCERKRQQHPHEPKRTVGPPKLGRADAKMG